MAQEERIATGPGPEATVAKKTPKISRRRLQVVITGLWLCLFISAIDTTIITTSLIKISSGFNALEQGAWLVTAYLLTYESFLLITAKLSDVWGLRTLLLGCAFIFLVFSMACGGAQTMVQLIVFRAFQGIGGSGLYSLTFVSIMKLVEPEDVGFYSGVISSVFAVSNLLGPLLGGIISDRTTWRWIFFINGPVVVIAMVLLFLSLPPIEDGKSNKERVKGLDSAGGILSICWPIPLIYALQEAGVSHPWSSSQIIVTLTCGIVFFFVFGLWETYVTYKTPKDPIFPIHFLRNPSMALILLSMFIMGMPYYVIFVQLPQRFQSVNFTTAERAGLLLLPATVVAPIGAMIAGIAAKKIAIEYILILSACTVCLGVGLLSSLPTGSAVWAGTYGYEVIAGLGLGLASPPYFMLIATSIPEKDVSVGTGALNMVRTLGGAVSVAICSAIHREHLSSRLAYFLSPRQITAVLKSSGYMEQLPEETKLRIGEAFGGSYNKQFLVMLGLGALNIVVTIVLAIVRKRMGIFATMTSQEAAATTQAAQEKTDDSESGIKRPDTAYISADQASISDKSFEGISIAESNASSFSASVWRALESPPAWDEKRRSWGKSEKSPAWGRDEKVRDWEKEEKSPAWEKDEKSDKSPNWEKDEKKAWEAL